jgi:aldose 1-epimerase
MKSNKMINAFQSIKTLSEEGFQGVIDGISTNLYILKNKNNCQAAITNYGARIVSLLVPDKNGILIDVVLGFDSIANYKLSTEPYFGATIGRYSNRIGNGKFKLDGYEYTLPKNNGQNTLHGGLRGFQDVVWNVEQLTEQSIQLSYFSKDKEEGFPGNVWTKVTYTLNDENALLIKYSAKTDIKTVLSFTNHAFFNLNGEGSGTILNHVLQINADKYTPVDKSLIPTGEIHFVKGTALDFTEPKTIGKDIESAEAQIIIGQGYDHNYVLNSNGESKLNFAARVIGDKSGIQMAVYTEEPGMQFYSGNFMQSKNVLKNGSKDDFRTSFALETQHFPDSPNHSNFPTTILEAGADYETYSVYQFSVIST